MTYTQAKECLNDIGRSTFEVLLESLGDEAIESGLTCDIPPIDIEEAYNGEWDSDEDFVKELRK